MTITSGDVDRADSGIDSNQSPEPLEPPKPDGYPVPLHALAAYMRDRTWLDLRTEHGPVHRVRIVEIVVRLEDEDVRVMQEWLEHLDDERKDVKRCRHYVNIDAEAIWKVGPTDYHIDEVEPYGLKIKGPRRLPQNDELMQHILTVVVQAATQVHDLTLAQLRETTNWKTIGARYSGMLVAYEMSDLEPIQITQAFGYKSTQPLVSARLEVRPGVQIRRGGLAEAIRKIGNLCDTMLMLDRPARRSGVPDNYSPVLER